MHPLVSALQDRRSTERFGRAMRGFEAVSSTNTRAAAWAQDGAPEGSVVLADHQSAGRGRHGRPWADAPGRNLLLSVVLRPTLPPDRFGRIMMAASVAVAATVDEAVPGRAQIKWPNDILLRGRKCCGMLLESSHTGAASDPAVAILGIGLNVNQTSFPPEVADTAISLQLAAQRPISRAAVGAALLAQLERRYDAIATNVESVRSAYLDRLVQLGQTVSFRAPDTGRRLRGTARGITTSGALQLETPSGSHTLHAGDVTSR